MNGYTITLRSEESLARFILAWMNYGSTASLDVTEEKNGTFTVTITN